MAKKKSKKKKESSNLLPKIFKFLFVAGLWVGIIVTLLFAWYAQELPSITKEATFEKKPSIIVKAADGSTLTRYGEVVGNSVTIQDISPHLVNAVLAIEDRRFYYHFGIDPVGILRAMFVNVSKGGFVQGGSTITQQLAKNLFLTQERTLKRKIQEAMLALWLEYELSKDEILSAYLNRVYLGAGIYGVDAAAKYYFSKDVKDITIREAALLAGMLKAPSRYSPLSNPGLANQRANLVIATMVEEGYVSKDEADNLQNLPPKPANKPAGADSVRYFTDWVVEGLDDIVGTPEQDIIVTTTLDPRVQEAAQASLIKNLMESGEAKNMSQGAVVSMAMDGAVIGLIGGRDYALSQFNRATQAKRPPGSSFKPIVYLTALEQGWMPDSPIEDAPFTEGRYRPENFAGEYFGIVDLQTALALSMNTAAVRVAKEVGIQNVVSTANRLGIISQLQPDLSLALGSNGITLLEMATAYTTIGNGGYKVFPYAITKIETEDGTLIYQRDARTRHQQAFNPRDIDNLTGMMRGVIEFGTGRGAAVPFEAAGKTGTSNDSRDALFIGFSDEMVTAVWVGNDDNSPMKAVTGGSFPARIWRDTMTPSRGLHPKKRGMFARGSFFSLLENITSGGPNISWRDQEEPSSSENHSADKPKKYND